MDKDKFDIIVNALGITGVIGMGLTGWWALDIEPLWTMFALITLPMLLKFIWEI